MLAAVHEKGWFRGKEGSGKRKKFSFGEKPVRLKGRKVEEAEETNKERKGERREGRGKNWAEQAIHGCK